jgi:hypothetical protein
MRVAIKAMHKNDVNKRVDDTNRAANGWLIAALE